MLVQARFQSSCKKKIKITLSTQLPLISSLAVAHDCKGQKDQEYHGRFVIRGKKTFSNNSKTFFFSFFKYNVIKILLAIKKRGDGLENQSISNII